MTDKERLIELLHKAEDICDSTLDCDTCKYVLSGSCKTVLIADYLLANGVIVPACDFKKTIYRVGEKRIYGEWELMYIQVYPDEILYIDDSDNYFTAEDIGKTVFLTKEEAEEKLKELGK